MLLGKLYSPCESLYSNGRSVPEGQTQVQYDAHEGQTSGFGKWVEVDPHIVGVNPLCFFEFADCKKS